MGTECVSGVILDEISSSWEETFDVVSVFEPEEAQPLTRGEFFSFCPEFLSRSWSNGRLQQITLSS